MQPPIFFKKTKKKQLKNSTVFNLSFIQPLLKNESFIRDSCDFEGENIVFPQILPQK